MSILKIRTLLFWLTVVVINSCNKPSEKNMVQYKDGKQVLNLNGLSRTGQRIEELKIEKISPDTIVNGDEFRAKLFLADKNTTLVAAYFNCLKVENPTVDTATNTFNYKRLDGCSVELPIENDTVYIAFRIGTLEKFSGYKTYTLEPITFLIKDKENIFRTQNYTFNIIMVDKK